MTRPTAGVLLLALLGPLFSLAQAGPFRSEGDQCVCQFKFKDAIRGGKFRGKEAGLYAGMDPVDVSMGRLDGMQARVSQLQDTFDGIKKRFDDMNSGAIRAVNRLDSLRGRVKKIRGDGCGKNSFQCGDSSRTCKSSVLICDGSADCPNGRDEDDDICEMLTPAGAVFEGNILVRDPCTKRKPETIRIVITSQNRKEYFKSRSQLTVALVLSFYNEIDQSRTTETLEATGYYDFVNRQMYISPPEDDLLALTCDFESETTRCRGTIMKENTGQICTVYYMNRKDE